MSRKSLQAEYKLCNNMNNRRDKDECRILINDIYKEGLNKGKSENSMCLSSIPNQVTSIPGTIGSLFTTKKEPEPAPEESYFIERPVFVLPPEIEEKEYTCDEKFNLFNSVFLPKQKTLSEYFSMINITVNGDILDFSKMYYSYSSIKLGNFKIEDIKNLLIKLEKFENCSILQKVRKIYLYNHNFSKTHIELIPFIFSQFSKVNEIRFGILNTVEQVDLSCGLNINCDIKTDENGRYILATKNLTRGGKRSKSKKQKSRKQRKQRKTKRRL